MTRPRGVLLDTNVLSETARKRPAPEVLAFLASLKADEVYVSAISIAEIERGIHLVHHQRPEQALMLRRWLETRLLVEYGNAVLPFDLDVARSWGLLMGTEQARRQPPPLQDSFIAATAYAHRLTLATRNTADFLAFPIAVVNPWA